MILLHMKLISYGKDTQNIQKTMGVHMSRSKSWDQKIYISVGSNICCFPIVTVYLDCSCFILWTALLCLRLASMFPFRFLYPSSPSQAPRLRLLETSTSTVTPFSWKNLLHYFFRNMAIMSAIRCRLHISSRIFVIISLFFVTICTIFTTVDL